MSKKKKIFVKKSQEFLISTRLSSLPLHTWKKKKPTLRCCNFSVQTDQVPHLFLILSFSPCSQNTCFVQPKAPWFQTGLSNPSFAQTLQILPSRWCLWRFGSTCARLHVWFCPTASLPSQCQWCWIPASSWGVQPGTGAWRNKGENYFWCRFSLSESCFPESWYLAERPMQLYVLKWALTFFSLPQSWIEPWFLFERSTQLVIL